LAEKGAAFGVEVLANLEKVGEAPNKQITASLASILLADAAGQMPTHCFWFQ
jgi:hypothetical protein